ncbi:unnamed protein product [Haemonchus placei]|uniref:MFS domain-containing protein n=1 Tax=Haemonchus placei TaxID=6290 RepID=A0A0N4WLM5_HAEPC|nr:unnamed protein product [Haemonchus placei]
MVSMAFLWCLSAMPTMSPAYMAPPTPCDSNCTFITVQEEFHLGRAILDPAELTSSVYFLGNLVLGQIYCMAADRIGRRPVLVWSLLVSGLAGVLAAFASNLYLMLLGRFIQGSFFNSITMINWVMCCESIAFKGHSYASVLFGVFWVAGYCLITPIALTFQSWRAVQFVTSFPTLLFGVVMLMWVLPFLFDGIYGTVGRTDTYGDLIFEASPKDRFLTFASFQVIKGSADKSFLFSGLVELPCYFIMPVALDRKLIYTIVLTTATGLSPPLLFFNEIPDSYPTIYLCIWLVAKFGMASAFMCCFVYGAEIFPVQYRNICLGFCATLSNIGAMMSPHCNILDSIFSGLMFATFAALSALCAFITTFLPETKNSH